MKIFGGMLGNQGWKVRERALMSIMMILEQKKSILPVVIQDIEKQIILRKNQETEERIKFLLDN